MDRGPDSFKVVSHLIEQEIDPYQNVINLKGNHEQLMLEVYKLERQTHRNYYVWIENGGDKTIASYDSAGFSTPPKHHLDWMKQLKTYHWDRAAKLIFVHAGIDPANFPNDGEDRHLWTRSRKFLRLKIGVIPSLLELALFTDIRLLNKVYQKLTEISAE